MKQTANDQAIIDLYWQRDERAIKETDRAYRARLLSLAKNLLHDAQDAEEVLNDTYVRVWNSIPPARPDSLKAYLLSIMRKTAINRFKASKRQKRVPAEMISSLSDLGDMLSDGDSFHSEQEARALGEILTDFTSALSDRFFFACIFCSICNRRSTASTSMWLMPSVNKSFFILCNPRFPKAAADPA